MKQNSGYILLHRKLRDNFLWRDKPFSRGQAWIDMLMMASYSGNQVLLGNHLVTLKRGEFVRSLDSLSRSWGWGIKRVRNFLALLQDMTMIRTKKGTKGTQITILNYDQYQKSGQEKGMQRARSGHAKGNKERRYKE